MGGNPARPIGRFENVMKKHRKNNKNIKGSPRFSDERIRQVWEEFDKEHQTHN